jgi:hypothetical protein
MPRSAMPRKELMQKMGLRLKTSEESNLVATGEYTKETKISKHGTRSA